MNLTYPPSSALRAALPVFMVFAIGVVYCCAAVLLKVVHRLDPMMGAVQTKKFAIQCWRNVIWVQMLLYPCVQPRSLRAQAAPTQVS